MVTKRPSSSSEGTRDGSLIKRVRRTTRLSEGLVQLGSPRAKCGLKLFPLATYSLRIARLIESVGDDDSEDSPLVIDLPDCPGDADIFRIVEDFSYGVMDEKDVSVSNVVKLVVTSNFLEMEGLASRALKFLEESVFSTWETCLSVLATFDCKDGSQFGEGTLFDKCKMAFLREIGLNRKTYKLGIDTVSCNVQCLVHVAKLLSPRVAELIYQSCRWEKFGLHFNTKSKNRIALSTHCRGDRTLERAREVTFYQNSMVENGEFVQFVADLCYVLPDPRRRSALVVHLAKSLHFENDANCPGQKILVSALRWTFVCALLVEAAELRRMSGFWTTPTERNGFIKELDKEIMSLQRLVSDGFGRADHRRSAEHTLEVSQLQERDSTIGIVKKFNFDTLLSIVWHLRDSGSGNSHILSATSLIDASLRENLKEDSFTVKQALMIYQEFPNDCRPSHAEIYHVFEDLLRRKKLSRQEVLDFTELLDYEKLSDEVVEKRMADLQFDCHPQLRERFTQMQRAHIEDKLQAECALKEVRHDLEVEQQKTTCQICFSRPRDALSLPCMHFLYCFECLQQHHQQQSKICPACRGSTTGVLKCILSI